MSNVSLPFGIFVPNCTLKICLFDLKVIKQDGNNEDYYRCILGDKSDI